MSDYDFVIVGSGFGGSAAGLRLVEKGYRVLMLEKGREFSAADLPKTNWNLRRWMWLPLLGLRGIFQLTIFRHMTVMSGVGVGGGSLTYGAALPTPPRAFFEAGNWQGLADWPTELAPHYATVRRMLGVTPAQFAGEFDQALAEVARRRGESDKFEPNDVGIYFGTPGKRVSDPFFGGDGPDRSGCIGCGGCMLGCPYNAKNTLDRNYLYLARARGLALESETEVTAVRALEGGGYRVEARQGRGLRRRARTVTARNVVLAAGVLGTVRLLLRMRADPRGLPRLSEHVGRHVRTNSESFIGVVSRKRNADMSSGVAIGSIYHCAPNEHVQPVRYRSGSGFFRLLMFPHVPGLHAVERLARLLTIFVLHPLQILRAFTAWNMARKMAILMYMRTEEGTLRFETAWHGGLTTRREEGSPPVASFPAATRLANEMCDVLDGFPMAFIQETLFNIPTTAHVLGGAVMGRDIGSGVIDAEQRVFGYEGLFVMDGSAVSSNPGVNPSLTITAMAERAVARIPAQGAVAPRPAAAAVEAASLSG